MPQELLLDVQRISKRLGDVQAVSDISFQVYSGEVVAILGPNGAGKSTTLKICEGVLKPDTGTVKFLGKTLTLSGSYKAHVDMGIMLQDNGGYPTAKLKEILQLYAQFYAESFDVNWLINLLDLRKVQNVTYRRLSGGQQQRLSLACAIIGKPKLLILDEPSAGLDFEGQSLIEALLKSLARDGVGVILTTHSLTELENVADRILIINDGKIIEEIHKDSTDNQRLYFHAEENISLDELSQVLPAGYCVSVISTSHYCIEGEINPTVLHILTGFGIEKKILFSEIRLGTKGLKSIFPLLSQPRSVAP